MTFEANAVVVGAGAAGLSVAPRSSSLFQKTLSNNQFFAAMAISSSFPQILTIATVPSSIEALSCTATLKDSYFSFYTVFVESNSHQVRVQEFIAAHPFQLAVVDDLETAIDAVHEIR